MANGLPYYRAYPRDFIEGTVGMAFELKGAYRLLIDLIYMQDGALPDDARYISGLLGCSVRKWNSYRKTLLDMGKIRSENEIISNFRADKELVISRTLSDKHSENRSRPNKIKGLQSPKPNHTTTDTYKEKILCTKRKSVGAKEKQISPRQELEKVLSPEQASNVLEHRQKLKKPLGRRAAELLAIQLARCRDPNAAADMMIERGWQGFRAEWYNNASAQDQENGQTPEFTEAERLAILRA